MSSFKDLRLVEPIRLIALFLVWACIAWPLWSYLIVDTSYRVLDFMPFLVNSWSLTGHSYESRLTDWRVWSINLLLPVLLSWASQYAYFTRIDYPGNGIALAAGVISILGSLPGFHTSFKVGQTYKRNVTIAKAGGLLLLTGLVMWGLDYAQSYDTNSAVPQFLLGSCVVIGLVESLVYVRSRKEHGIGSPLLWLSLRVLLTPGVKYFWVWWLFCIVSFETINIFQKRPSTVKALHNHWRNWQTILGANSFLLLNLAVGISLLVANGNCVTTNADLGNDIRTYCQNNKIATNLVSEYQNQLCYNNDWLYLPLNEIVNTRMDCTGSEITVHQMFESEASIAAVLLLDVATIGFSLRTLKDPKTNQGYWIPIFFFSTAVMILLFQRSKLESLAFLDSKLSFSWADDAILAICFSVAGGLIAAIVSAFSIKGMEIKRERTRFLTPVHQSTNWLNLGLFLIEVITIASTCLWFITPQSSVLYKNSTIPYTLGGIEDLNNDSDIANWLLVFGYQSLSSSQQQGLLATSNCTTEGCLFSASTAANNCSLWNNNDVGWQTSLAAVQISSKSQVFWDVPVSLSGLMQNELVAVAVMTVVGAFCTIGAIKFPVLDDWSLLWVLASSITVALAVPLRMREYKALGLTIIFEWSIFVTAISLLASSAIAVLIRVDIAIPVNPWENGHYLDECFAKSDKKHLSEYVYSTISLVVNTDDPGEAWTMVNDQIAQLHKQRGSLPTYEMSVMKNDRESQILG